MRDRNLYVHLGYKDDSSPPALRRVFVRDAEGNWLTITSIGEGVFEIHHQPADLTGQATAVLPRLANVVRIQGVGR